MFAYSPFKLLYLSRIPADEVVTLYRCGSFIDLCRGPHVNSTKAIGGMKLLRTGATQWSSDSPHNISRIHGIAFPTGKALREWTLLQKEAADRDHRHIGRKQSLFYFSPVSPGAPFFMPHESDHPMQALKPMNCPGHCLLFGSTTRSYRDLPIRYAEFSHFTASGALTGLTRVRKFHQDDGHIFCTPAQVSQEIASTLSFIDYMYTVVFQFPHYKLALSTRPTDGYVGELAQWDIAESALRETLDASGREWSVQEGEGAFYGPKIDVSVRDALGRYHQTATIQLDFQLPARFGLTYQTSGADGEGVGATDTPVMVHRAILGSIERMLAILTEHWGGRWPFWISPRQAIVVPVNDKLNAYAQHIKLAIARGGHGRADLHGAATEATPMSSAVSTPHYFDVDSSNNLLSKRIREAQLLQYNYILVVGDKELEAGTVSVRTRTGKDWVK
ncbi:threonine-tRNA ligase [Batrachochytrium salamandrivorans]|nr:threonine-tRNA ligase [Batrachochytrium salamandrivorans]